MEEALHGIPTTSSSPPPFEPFTTTTDNDDDILSSANSSHVIFFDSRHQPQHQQTNLTIAPYYSPAYKAIGCLFVSAVFVVGLFGNAMVVAVVWRTKSMRTTTNCYLVSLAVADVILLVSAPLPTIAELFFVVDETLFGAVGCSVMVFFQYLGVNLSSLSITAFTVERYIAICHPMKAQTMCTISRAKKIIGSLWVLGVLYCAPWLVLVTTKFRTYRDGIVVEYCTFKLKREEYLIYYMLDLLLFYAVPLALTCLLYGLIARVLIVSSRPGTSTAKVSRNGTTAGSGGQTGRSSNINSRIQVRY